MPTETEFKQLRKKIMAISAKKYGWDYDQFHDLMEEWNYGRSLRELDWHTLCKLRNELLGIVDYEGYEKFDKDGKHMWFLAKQSWPEDTMNRLQHFWIKHYHKSHWNILNEKERRATKNMLKSYINQGQEADCG